MRSTKYSVTTVQILDATIKNEDIDPNAAIAKSKLAALGIVDADVAIGAAIAKSKLAALGIVDADVAIGAAIAQSKIAGSISDYFTRLGIDTQAGDVASLAVTNLADYDMYAVQFGVKPATAGAELKMEINDIAGTSYDYERNLNGVSSTASDQANFEIAVNAGGAVLYTTGYVILFREVDNNDMWTMISECVTIHSDPSLVAPQQTSTRGQVALAGNLTKIKLIASSGNIRGEMLVSGRSIV